MTLAKFLALRSGLILLSSGVFAFMSQIAVFIYTRSEGVIIPLGDIIGFSASSFSMILGFFWAVIFLILFFIKNIFYFIKKSNSESDISNFDMGDLRKNLIWGGVFPISLALMLSIYFVFCSKCTAKTLNAFGYGGGMFCSIKDMKTKKELERGSAILLSSNTVYFKGDKTKNKRLLYSRILLSDSNIEFSCATEW